MGKRENIERLVSWSREFTAEWKERFSEWDRAFGLQPDEPFFGGREEMPDFEFRVGDFDAATAWWLGELCRLAYTPNHKERLREEYPEGHDRVALLEDRSPFQECLSVHKTGNHASIYRLRDEKGGTIVCFRGTSGTRQWIMNTVIRPHEWRRFRAEHESDEAFVHSGFYVLFKRIWPQLLPTLETLPRPWIFTGHSLGGALATIAGVVSKPDLLCTFGAPKVGNADFVGLKGADRMWRIVNDVDLVPRLPVENSKKVDVAAFVHGVPSIRLTDSGEPQAFDSIQDEGELPFDLKTVATQMEKPPEWLTEHRMSIYLRRLQRIALDA